MSRLKRANGAESETKKFNLDKYFISFQIYIKFPSKVLASNLKFLIIKAIGDRYSGLVKFCLTV